MALDDGADLDPATLPENVGLIAEADAQIAAAEKERERQRALERLMASVLPDAVSEIDARVTARSGSHAREEDLRSAVADALRSRGELVLTEAKLRVPGWTPNLGGFDIAVVTDNSLVVAETKWADGNLYECMWDLFKLGSAQSIPRVDAAVAIYGAPIKHWQRPDGCGRLFEDREVVTRRLIWGLSHDWQVNLAGSSAKPLSIPVVLKLRSLSATSVEILGKPWEVRALGVVPHGGDYKLTDGWPEPAPDVPEPYTW